MIGINSSTLKLILSIIISILSLAFIAKSQGKNTPIYHNYHGYQIKADSNLIIHSMKIAHNQVGVIEYKENDSPMIRRYLLSVGISRPASYCAAGIYWCMDSSIKKLKYNTDNIPLPRTGVANAHYNYAKATGNKYLGNIKAGDLLVWRRPNSWQGHIEIVTEVDGYKIKTIGFNTSRIINGRSVEGVWRQERIPLHPLGRLKYRGVIHFDNNIGS